VDLHDAAVELLVEPAGKGLACVARGAKLDEEQPLPQLWVAVDQLEGRHRSQRRSLHVITLLPSYWRQRLRVSE
jgi:hypothetical protein